MMRNKEEYNIEQEEIKLKIGMVEVELYCSPNALNVIINQPNIDFKELISIQDKGEILKTIIWNSKKGLIDNSIYSDE